MNPVIFTFTESPGGERYAVHAGGEISRPAIGMGPSGGWLFTGIANGRGEFLASFEGVCERLADGLDIPRTCYVRDLDHGTARQHGAALADIRLAPERPHGWLGLVEKLARERRDATRERERMAAAGRLEIARKARRHVATIEGVEVRAGKGGRFFVIDGDSATEPLDFTAAAQALGAALIERHS